MNYVEQEGQPVRRFPPPHSFPKTSFTPPLNSMTESELLKNNNIKSWQAGELVLHHKLSVAWRGLTAYALAGHTCFLARPRTYHFSQLRLSIVEVDLGHLF
jgi:hypothetical protein